MRVIGDLALELRGFGAAFGSQTVLGSVDLVLERHGLTTLVGPAGAGKSTLLRTLAGFNDTHPEFTTWGVGRVAGIDLATTRPPAAGAVRRDVGIVTQHARFFLDDVRRNLAGALPNRSSLDLAAQRRVITDLLRANGLAELADRLGDDVASLPTAIQRRRAIVRAIASDPALLLADEPTAGLSDDDAVGVLALLRAQSYQRAVLLVTHNQRHARAAGGFVALLAGGGVVERSPVTRFFREPGTDSGRRFVRTGGTIEPSPSARSEDLAPGTVRTIPSVHPPPAAAPRGFFWVVPGRLGGLPRPGVGVADTETDVASLARLGVTTLVTLEESPTVEAELLASHAIASLHFPIPDMGVPELSAARDFCRDLAARMARGEVVALHCRAGLGRTGTMLACQLVHGGASAREAIDAVRSLNPRCIQSAAQVAILSDYERNRATHPEP